MKRTVRIRTLSSMTEEEKAVCDKAAVLMDRFEREGKIKPNAENLGLVDIDATDEEHAILTKAVEILGG